MRKSSLVVALTILAWGSEPGWTDATLLEEHFDSWADAQAHGWSKGGTSVPTGSPKVEFVWTADPAPIPKEQEGVMWFRGVWPSDPAKATYSTGSPGSAYLMSPTFTIKGKGNVLRFSTWEYMATGENGEVDVPQVWLMVDGTWQLASDSYWSLQTTKKDTDDVEFARAWVSLDAWATAAGKSVRVLFYVNYKNQYAHNGLGWGIDKVYVTRQNVPILDGWGSIPGLLGAPATIDYDGRLEAAGFDAYGHLLVTRTDLSGDWEPPVLVGLSTISTGKAGYLEFNSNLGPTLGRASKSLYLFGVGVDGRLYVMRRPPGTSPAPSWESAIALTLTNGVVTSSPSVVVTNPEGGPVATHVVFRFRQDKSSSGAPLATPIHMVRWIRLQGTTVVSDTQVGTGVHSSASVRPTVASDGVGIVAIATPYPTGPYSLTRVYKPSGAGWTLAHTSMLLAKTSVGLASHAGSIYAFYGLSSALGAGAENRLTFNRIDLDNGNQGMNAALIWTTLPGATLAELRQGGGKSVSDAKLVNEASTFSYKGHLGVLFRDWTTGVYRCIRLENATYGSAALRPFREESISSLQPVPGFAPIATAQVAGEVFATMPTPGSAAPRYLCLTRHFFWKRLSSIGLDVQPNGNESFGTGYKTEGLWKPWPKEALHRLTLMSAIGRPTWDYPEWVSGKFFSAFAAEKGTPCRIAVQSLGKSGAAQTDINEVRLDPGDTDPNVITHELGHWLYTGGLDAGSSNSVDMFSSGGVNDANQNLFAVFYSQVSGKWVLNTNFSPVNDADGDLIRLRGFVGTYGSVTGVSPSHGWLDALTGYRYKGDKMFEYVLDDQANGLNAVEKSLLWNKYKWMRSNLWGTIEFQDGGDVLPGTRLAQ